MKQHSGQFRLQRAPDAVMHVARDMRKAMTPAEARLWTAIRNRQLDGLRFRAQHPVDRFVLDFYCPSARLVVEVDGDVHIFQVDYDNARDKYLRDRGYRIVRVTNDEVMTNLNGVLEQIRATASE